MSPVFLPIVCSGASIPYHDYFLRTLEVSHGPHMTLAAILKREIHNESSIFAGLPMFSKNYFALQESNS